MQFCTACGAPLNRGSFCTECGARVEGLSSDTADLPPLPPLQPLEPIPSVTPTRSRWGMAAAVAAVLVTALAVGCLTWLLTSRGEEPAPAAAGSPTSSASSPSSAPPTSPAALPSTASDISFARVASHPDLAAVAPVLDTYFSGVNMHDAAMAISVFSPLGASNPNDPANVQRLSAGIQTTTDDEVAVQSIEPSTLDDAAGVTRETVAVRVTFRSRQDPTQGYHGQACSLWTVTYHLIPVPSWTTAEGPTHFRILGTSAQTPAAC